MHFVETILRKHVKSTPHLESFLNKRKVLKSDAGCKRNLKTYKAARKLVEPALLSAKSCLQNKVTQHELQNIKQFGFIKATERNKDDLAIQQLTRELEALEHYLYH